MLCNTTSNHVTAFTRDSIWSSGLNLGVVCSFYRNEDKQEHKVQQNVLYIWFIYTKQDKYDTSVCRDKRLIWRGKFKNLAWKPRRWLFSAENWCKVCHLMSMHVCITVRLATTLTKRSLAETFVWMLICVSRRTSHLSNQKGQISLKCCLNLAFPKIHFMCCPKF